MNEIYWGGDYVIGGVAAREKNAAAEENAGQFFHVASYTTVSIPRNYRTAPLHARCKSFTSLTKRAISSSVTDQAHISR
jgi:hypothetical protein